MGNNGPVTSRPEGRRRLVLALLWPLVVMLSWPLPAMADDGTSTPTPTPTYKTPQTVSTTIGSSDHLPGFIVAAILLGTGVAFVVTEHRRRQRRQNG